MSCSPPSVKKPCYDRSSLPKAPVTRRLLQKKIPVCLGTGRIHRFPVNIPWIPWCHCEREFRKLIV